VGTFLRHGVVTGMQELNYDDRLKHQGLWAIIKTKNGKWS